MTDADGTETATRELAAKILARAHEHRQERVNLLRKAGLWRFAVARLSQRRVSLALWAIAWAGIAWRFVPVTDERGLIAAVLTYGAMGVVLAAVTKGGWILLRWLYIVWLSDSPVDQSNGESDPGSGPRQY